MRGRKVELRAIEGGLSRLPPAPSWLPDEAKTEWRRVVPEIRKRKTLTRADLTTLELFCLAVGTARRMQAAIARDGDTVITEKGGARRHAGFQTMFQAMTEARRLAAELGLTPASRAKAPAAGGEADNLDDFDL